MRKMLLMGAAALGASVAISTAPAFAAGPVAGPSMGAGSPPPFLGFKAGQEGAPLAPGEYTPTPGTMVIHLNGRTQFWASLSGSPADNPGTGAKNEPYDFHGFIRLYPGVAAMAANGLRYGALVEIRQDFGGVGGSQSPDALGYGGSTGASGQSGGETLYVRRAAIYLGTNQFGLVRLGQDDGPFSQMDGGVTTFQFNDGAWNGDAPGTLTSGYTQGMPTWPFWSGIGNTYTVTKAVYMSPEFSGFDFMISYAPNNTANRDSPGCSIAGSGCTTLETSTSIADTARAKDWFEIMGRYRGTFNGVGVYGIAGYSGSSHVNSTAGSGYDGFSVGDVGLVLSYAGFKFGGNFMVGDFNGQAALKPKGGVHGLAWVVGAEYKTGPVNLGVSYFNYQDQGAPASVGYSQRYNSGLAVSADYAVAPGLSAIATYLYGWAHQGGLDLVTDQVGTSNNTVWSQAFILEGKIVW